MRGGGAPGGCRCLTIQRCPPCPAAVSTAAPAAARQRATSRSVWSTPPARLAPPPQSRLTHPGTSAPLLKKTHCSVAAADAPHRADMLGAAHGVHHRSFVIYRIMPLMLTFWQNTLRLGGYVASCVMLRRPGCQVGDRVLSRAWPGKSPSSSYDREANGSGAAPNPPVGTASDWAAAASQVCSFLPPESTFKMLRWYQS